MIALDPERAFVGALLHISPRAMLAAFTEMHLDDIADPQLHGVAQIAFSLASAGVRPDPIVVLDEARRSGIVGTEMQIKAMTTLLLELHANVPTASSVSHYAAAVLAEAVRNRARQAVTRIHEQIETGSLSNLMETIGTEAAAVRDVAERHQRATSGRRRLAVAG